MSAFAVLAEANTAGVSLRARGEVILAEPRAAITDALRTSIRANRQELLAVLRGDPAPRYWRFLVTYPDGRREEIRTLPEATFAEALRLWPKVQIEPIAEAGARTPGRDVARTAKQMDTEGSE